VRGATQNGIGEKAKEGGNIEGYPKKRFFNSSGPLKRRAQKAAKGPGNS